MNVILPLPLAKMYTYRVPQDLSDAVQPGKRVVVQFGKKRMYSAIIHSVQHQPPRDYEAKYLLALLDEEPMVSPTLLKFWDWMAQYYLCTPGEVMQAALPAPFKLESETKVRLNPACDTSLLELSDKEYLVLEALTMQEELSLDEISAIVQLKNVFPLLKSLYLKEAVLLTEEMKEQYKPRTVACVALNDPYQDEAALEQLFMKLEKTPKQSDLLMAYLHLKHTEEHVLKSGLLELAKVSASSLKTMANKGIFSEYRVQVDRLEKTHSVQESFELNAAQQEAYQQVQQAFAAKDVVLLHGVTSSGKTHVYVKLIEEALQKGKQVLFLLPEIALTSQIVSRIKKYFGDRAIAFHSRFTQNERVELWEKIRKGEAGIVIGARSAVFLPFAQLGLVIVDEEHESSYKQQDPAPRYHARDAGIFLGHLWNCKTLLGSATPSFESYHNCVTEKYGLVTMTQRFGDIEMPQMLTANIAEESRVKTMKGSFTSALLHEMDQAIAQHEQVILFQNRRGYAPVYECQSCRWVTKCINCDISLTYHKSIDSLKCHYCGYTRSLPKSCPACGSHVIELKGTGTEKIEDELQVLLPQARVSRLDLDAGKTKHGHEQIIQGFENHEADILVGTQMISKGLDFAKVSVVGIINADQLLYFPDFRANERAFQLISQVSGRAGRKNRQGRVIIQTSSPEHRVIQQVIHHEYAQLYADECEARRQFQYPPFFRLIKLVIKHKDYSVATGAAFELKQHLETRLGDRLLGPESPYVSRIRNLYLKEILIKIDRNSAHLHDIKQFIRKSIVQTLENTAFRRAMIYADVDPF